MKKIIRRHGFTLIELIVSMAVFALLGMMVAQLFSASQKLWTSTSQKSDLAAEAQQALNRISDLLLSAASAPQESLSTSENKNVGSNYFFLDNQGTSALGGNTSRLYFVTRSTNPALTSESQRVPIFFAGVQVAKIDDDSSDPDNDACVLELVISADDGSNSFEERFPDNSSDEITSLPKCFNAQNAKSFEDMVNADASPISRIATNVVDFQIRAWDEDDIASATGMATFGDPADPSLMPDAIEITLVLMSREHLIEYYNAKSDPNAKPPKTKEDVQQEIYDRHARSFRRMIWLDGARRREPAIIK